jgi:hypothetical protein
VPVLQARTEALAVGFVHARHVHTAGQVVIIVVVVH